MKKLLLILICFPLIGFGQEDCGDKPTYKENKFDDNKQKSKEYKTYKKEFKIWKKCNKDSKLNIEQELITYFDKNRTDPLEGIWVFSVKGGQPYGKYGIKKSDNIYLEYMVEKYKWIAGSNEPGQLLGQFEQLAENTYLNRDYKSNKTFNCILKSNSLMECPVGNDVVAAGIKIYPKKSNHSNTKTNIIAKTNIIKSNNTSSLVDNNIPINSKVKNRYALVIGNEDYTSFQTTLNSEQNVDYAVNDATIFREYCLKTLGVKEDNMFFITNATAGKMNQEIKRVTEIVSALGSNAELIFYYAGHGYPDEITKSPYLIPVDVSGSDMSYAVKLDDLYKALGETNAKRITIFLDACFTGGGRTSGLVASRGVKVKPKEGTLNGNIVVFAASSGDQSALPYHKEGHGVFTFHLLKQLQANSGDIEYGAIFNQLEQDVNITSLKENSKKQNPEVNTSQKVINDWRNWKF